MYSPCYFVLNLFRKQIRHLKVITNSQYSKVYSLNSYSKILSFYNFTSNNFLNFY